jgi:plasmid stabilization system protein ParE
MRVRYTRRAQKDLAAILAYIDTRSPPGARNVKLAIQKVIDLIGDHPEMGRLSGIEETRVISVGRYPYLIYWRILNEEVWLIHIRHAARRPWAGGDD